MTPLTKKGPGRAPDPDHVRAVSYIRRPGKREGDGKSSPDARRTTTCAAPITAATVTAARRG
ncbi:hypothetical protein OG539_15475 [Actinacidiphila glaucinigra]|uniref:hypothetical protein n=1 Tax=Actinacidiphila glaucinigra TaxID=235986 RepID=UPI0032436BAE